MEKIRYIFGEKRFLYGLLVFIVFMSLYAIFLFFYKPLLISSKSVNFKFGLVKQNFSLEDIKVGTYVSFFYDYTKDPSRIKLDVAQGKLFVKRVICVGGQNLYVDKDSRSFYCDGIFIGKARKRFLNGDEAPIFLFDGKIPEGYVFVEGDTKFSFDSRYWGFVKIDEVLGIVIPLF